MHQLWLSLAYVDRRIRFSSLLPLPDSGNRILMYHSVGGGYYDDVSVNRFRAQIEQLTQKYDVVDLPDATKRTDRTRVAVTFDDGTADFFENVRPILHEYDVPATVFVISNSITDEEFTHDDRFEYEYMGEEQLVELAADDLVTIGNHTRSHPNLAELTTDELRREIEGAKRELEERLAVDVTRFCYPYGDYSREAVEIVRSTHDLGVAGITEGYVDESADPHLLSRINGASEPYQLEWEFTDCSMYIVNKLSSVLKQESHGS